VTRLLLDTCALLWMSSNPTELSRKARAAMADPESALFVSAISAWEIGVKQRRGRLELPDDAARWFPAIIEEFGIEEIAMDGAIALRAAGLEWDHRDPADRIVVATAMVRGMAVITADTMIAGFPQVVVEW
jgi:PIN domain nuclease of toxin-antitoxin system